MRLQVKFKKPGLADCEVSIRAKGFLTAMLYWAIETVPIPGWSLIAAVPLDATVTDFSGLEETGQFPGRQPIFMPDVLLRIMQ